MKKALLIAALLIGCAVTTACDPVTTITATTASRPGCGQTATIDGTVTPASATGRVVLQRTVGGKWVDWKWVTGNTGEVPHVLRSKVAPDTGTYVIPFQVPFSTNTIHLRVRSDGGSVVSRGMYVTPTEYDDDQCI